MIEILLPESSHSYEIVSDGKNSSLRTFCSTILASSKALIKNFEDPSIIGTSGPSRHIKQLSISKPVIAANTCSDVCILNLPLSRLVPLSVLDIYFI